MSTDNGHGQQDPFAIQDFTEFMDSMADEAKAYAGAQRDYLTLVMAEKAAKGAGSALNSVVSLVLLGSVLAFLNIALALWLGEVMGSLPLGFLVVGGGYLVLYAIYLLIWRQGLKDKFTLGIINAFYHEKD